MSTAQESEGASAIDVTGDGEGVEMSQDESTNEMGAISMMVAADLHALESDESL